MKKTKNATIILLNGTSSSGKSVLLKELHKIQPCYEILKVDAWFPTKIVEKAQEFGWHKELEISPWFFLHDYVSKNTNTYYFDTELRKLLFSDFSGFYHEAKTLALNGYNIIIDTVLEHEMAYEEFSTFFKDFNVIKVLIYCPLNIIMQRTKERNKAGIPEEQRPAFQAFEQFPEIYMVSENPNKGNYVDTVKSKVMKQALDDAILDLIKNNIPHVYLPKLEKFKKDFIRQFKLDEQEEIVLVTKNKYDIILNSGSNSPEELVTKTINYFE